MLNSEILRKNSSAIHTGRGKNIKVAVLDSGIHPNWPGNHPERGKFFAYHEGRSTYQEKAFWDSLDPSGHGSIVDWCIRSVAPESQTDHIKVLEGNNEGYGEQLIKALEFVIAEEYPIIHLSLGTKNHRWVPALSSLMRKAKEKGCTIIAASSNINTFLFPALLTYSISCTAIPARHPLHIAHYPRSSIEFGAMGVQLQVPILNGKSMEVTGSSFAAAFITGIIARLLSCIPDLTPEEIKILLKNYSHTIRNYPENQKSA